MTYGVIGTGGIGGYYGGLLAKAGEEVYFLFHSDYEYVRENGLRVDSVDGDYHLPRVNAYRNTTDMPRCDVVLVGLKTTNNHLLKDLLPPILKPDTLVILIQNGLGVEDDVRKDFPSLNLAGGLAFICSQKTGPGYVTHLDYGKLILAADNPEAEAIVKAAVEDMGKAEIKVEYASDLLSARWRKLVWNIPYNGSTVVLNTSTEALMANPVTESLMYDLMMEVIRAANACGIKHPIEESFARRMLDMTRVMTPYSPSMKLDYDNHRPLEVEYIYSRPVEVARRHGFEMSRVSMLERQLRFLE